MALQFSVSVRNEMLDRMEVAIGVSPTLEIRSGAPPANAAAADTGSVISTLALPSDYMSAASGGTKQLLGTWQDVSADATGRMGHFRLKQGATTHIQGLVSEAWLPSKVYAIGDQVHNGGNIYRASAAGTSAGSGGPSGTGASIADNTVTWAFVQTGLDLTVDNAAINVGQQFTINNFGITAGNA